MASGQWPVACKPRIIVRMKPDLAAEIVAVLREKGHEAYFVGGCVRDMVMGLEPADYDIATSARPEEIERIFQRTEPVGAQFGVMLVIHRGHPFEVATFRSDQAYVDGRRPTGVVFTDAKQDVLRRDFTINGLLYDPAGKAVIDFVGGGRDIEAKLVRAIGNPLERFEEDKLRILRAIRFGARLGYTIDPETWSAVCAMAPKIRVVSAERIRDELCRILTEGQAAAGFRMLEHSGLRAEIFPELAYTPKLNACLAHIAPGAEADFALGVLLHELTPGTASDIVERLKLSNAESAHVLSLIEHLDRFEDVIQMPQSTLKRFLRIPRFGDHLELFRIHCLSLHTPLDSHNFVRSKLQAWSRDQIAPEPLISGDDLIAVGFTPGPLFKEILTRVEDEQLEGRLDTSAAALDFVRRQFGSAGRENSPGSTAHPGSEHGHTG